VRRVVTRVALLIGLGLVLNFVASWPALSPLRIPGVLQRIALSYLIASLVVLYAGMWGTIAVAAALLAGHWALLSLVPFDGHPAGTLTPDHNLARYLDGYVFGRHAWMKSTDPEGLLGTLSAAATTLIGASIGHLMRRTSDGFARLRSLVAAGLVLVVVGWYWSFWLPLSKPLWTGSYAVLTAGLATLVLALLYWTVDVLGWRLWARPFMWLGVNPLAIYFCSEILGHVLDVAWLPHGTGHTTPKTWLVWSWLVPALRPRPLVWASLLFAVAFVTFWMAIARTLHERHIRIQV
jgi:predicted acyltransferase